MTALQPGAAGACWQQLGAQILARWGRPRAVIAVSAHSLAHEPTLLAAARHEAVYDFGGFDPALRDLRYDAPGAPELAAEVAGLMRQAGLPAHVQRQGGLDHGIWTPLRSLFPSADIPVLPLAWPAHWAPQQLFALGQVLAPLADKGVLVLGSGSITHNLSRFFGPGSRPDVAAAVTPQSQAFRQWFVSQSQNRDLPSLFDYRAQAPHAVLMHPTDEHLLPWFVAAGAGLGPGLGEHTQALRVHASTTYGDLGMDVYAFGQDVEVLSDALPR